MELDCDELMLVMKALGQQPTKEDLDDLVAKVDEDGSGVIELEEFFVLMELLLKEQDTPEGLEQAFKAFDIDGDSFITSDELRVIMCSMGEKLSTEEADEIIRRTDKNGDGKLVYEEFVALFKGCPRPHDEDEHCEHSVHSMHSSND